MIAGIDKTFEDLARPHLPAPGELLEERVGGRETEVPLIELERLGAPESQPHVLQWEGGPMAEPVYGQVADESISQHPAFRAWKQLKLGSSEPARIEILKFKAGKKSGVYRLCRVGPEGAAVIAKRCRTAESRVERLIYEEVLPAICKKLSPHYYGFITDPDDERYCWLFLEYAEGLPYSPLKEEHRALAGRWLGKMHLAALPAEIQTRLPSREPAYYLQSLQDCRGFLLDRLSHNPNLPDDGGAVFQRVAGLLDILESRWSRVAEVCKALPRTLVHGSFSRKNLRVQKCAGGTSLLVFDWEFAGWGVAATDFAQFGDKAAWPDLNAYCSVLNCAYPRLQLEDVERVAACGNFFRMVDAVRWLVTFEEPGSGSHLVKAIETLRIYESVLAKELESLKEVLA